MFKMSHYIDCLVFRPDRDTDGVQVWRCGGVSLGDISVSAVASARVTRVQQQSGDTGADVTTWFLHPTSSCSVEEAPSIRASVYNIIHIIRRRPGTVSILKGRNGT